MGKGIVGGVGKEFWDGMEFPELWLLLDAWKCPRKGWTGLGAVWDSGKHPWIIPSKPKHSRIPRFQA